MEGSQVREIIKKLIIVDDPLLSNGNIKVLNNYLFFMIQKGNSEETIERVRNWIRRLLREMSKEVADITSEDIYNWLQNNYSHCTRWTKIAVIKNLKYFFQFCVDKGVVERNPIKSRWQPRTPAPVPKPFDNREMAKILSKAETLTMRNRIIVQLFYATGIRRSEMAALTVGDVNIEERFLRIHGKGKKERLNPFNYDCYVLLKPFIANRDPSEPLFLASKGPKRGLARNTFYGILRKFGTSLGLKIHPHRFRYSFATKLANEDESYGEIARLLGHSNVDQPQRVTIGYIDIAVEQQQYWYEQYYK